MRPRKLTQGSSEAINDTDDRSKTHSYRSSRMCRHYTLTGAALIFGMALAHITLNSTITQPKGEFRANTDRDKGSPSPHAPQVDPKSVEYTNITRKKGSDPAAGGEQRRDLFSIPGHRTCEKHMGVLKKTRKEGGERTIKFRDGKQNMWYSEGCSQWDLTGEWKPRNRKIYYSFMFADEAEILQVVLHEIYPVVDVIIILECTKTWQGEEKPMFFPKLNQTEDFQKYADKIRYIPYNFDDPRTKDLISRCMDEELAGPNWPPGMMQCRWLRQWGARDFLSTGAKDMGPHDAFVVADLDELLAREFLRAIKHCDVFPEGAPKGTPKDACGRMGVFTFGHKYYFDCTVDRPNGHYHPNIALGKCLKIFGAEELKRWWGEPKKYFLKPKGLLDTKMAGPGGWHMHSFLTTARVLWKWFSRSGRSAREHSGKWDNRWDVIDLASIREQRKSCSENPSFLSFDSEACEPLPHIVREDPSYWKHYIRYVPDSEIPDKYNVQPWYHERLMSKFDNSKGEHGGDW